MPHFQYSSTMWHFCGARNSEILELLNKHVLLIILDDKVSTYEMLLECLDLVSLRKRRFLDMFVDLSSQVLSSSHTTNINWLRGINKFQLPRVNTTSYGKNSFKFLAPKELWNILHDDSKTTTSMENYY